MVIFDLVSLILGQTTIVKHKSVYNMLYIGPNDLGCETNL